MGWAPDPTKFSESLSEKKVQKAGFLRSITAISWKPPHTSEGKGKKERKSEKDESRRTEK